MRLTEAEKILIEWLKKKGKYSTVVEWDDEKVISFAKYYSKKKKK